jgi:tyrocidine synthetase III
MKDLIGVLSGCRKKGISLATDDSGRNLKIKGNVGALSEEEMEMLRSHKEAIIVLLKQSVNPYDPIVPAGQQPCYELSSAQKRIWILSQLYGAGLAYHISLTNVFEGALHTEHLTACLDSLIERHAVLRTVFREDESGEVRQYIRSAGEMNFSISCIDIRNEEDKDRELKKRVRESRCQPFDLAEGPLLRASLYRLSDREWVFDFDMHHIIGDGWSMDILIRELLLLYNARCRHEEKPLLPLSIQYADYAHWEQKQLTGTNFREHLDYWLKQFEGELPVLELPGDKIRPSIKTYNGRSAGKKFNAGLTEGLRALVRQQDCTLFMGLLALVKTLLYRYTGQTDIIIGSPIAGREQGGLEGQVGLYMNTLALRTQFTVTDSYPELLQKVREVTLGAYAHQVYPFDLLVEALHLQRDRSRSPLFDVMMAFRDTEGDNTEKQPYHEGLRVAEYKIAETERSKFDLFFNFIGQGEEIELVLIYNDDIYTPETIERLTGHLEQLLTVILKDPSLPIRELEYLSAKEIQQLLAGFNDTRTLYPIEKTIVDLFEEQVSRTPDRIALVFEETQLSYAKLNEEANRIAHYLLADHSIHPDAPVAVMLDRSAAMIIAILAIMKSGAAYLPIDPDYPAHRIEYILKDSEAEILLTASRYLPRFTAYGGAAIAVDAGMDGPAIRSGSPGVTIRPADLAYIIYTSGSTGHPKGVMISHGSLVDYCFGVLDRTNIRECRHFGMVSTIAADLGNTVIYPSLLTGGTLHIYPAAALSDAERIFDRHLDCIKIVPSHWSSLQCTDTVFLPDKCLIFGGEPLTPDILDKIKQAGRRCEVYNHYGPSETTVGKLIRRIDPDHFTLPIPLGAPFCDSSFYIVDEGCKLIPIGVIGEICISGAGLARGYLNQPELTGEKFVPDPFKKGERMYKTGDLGRWLPDGTIAFMGRRDDQVKIRGYRVEPGEIEAAIRCHEDIETAVVLATSNAGGEKELIAYLVSRTDLKTADMRAYLSRTLPAYMIPACFIRLDRLPLTLNGKIDKKALPDPAGSALPAGTPYIAPRNDTESKLVSIWQELLGNKQIGIKDNFFDLGGHSLKMMQLITRINGSFSIRLNIQSIFSEPDIENISEQIFFIRDQMRQKENKKNLKRLEI